MICSCGVRLVTRESAMTDEVWVWCPSLECEDNAPRLTSRKAMTLARPQPQRGDDVFVQAMIAMIFPPRTAPRPCPRCGRAPEFVQGEALSWFECRRWFGLKLCHRGEAAIEGRGDGEWAYNAAAIVWNKTEAR